MKIIVIQNNNIENYDLKGIHLEYKDLSKIFQQQSHPIEHPSHKKHKHVIVFFVYKSLIFFFLFYYIYFNDVCVFTTNWNWLDLFNHLSQDREAWFLCEIFRVKNGLSLLISGFPVLYRKFLILKYLSRKIIFIK